MSKQITTRITNSPESMCAVEMPTHPRFENLQGKTFGNFHVAWYAGSDKGRQTASYWLCVCVCGQLRKVKTAHLKSGAYSGCGCKKRKYRNSSSGHAGLYRIWRGMKDRCHRPAASYYKWYGARGITVCQRWRDSFDHFFEDVFPRPEGLSLDRIDNDCGYWCGKCKECVRLYRVKNWRWADAKTQANNKTTNRRITVGGKTLSADEWGKRIGLGKGAVANRIDCYGWTAEQAVTYGPNQNRRNARLVTHDGLTMNAAAWARRVGLSRVMLYNRLDNGWSVEDALTIPAGGKRGNANGSPIDRGIECQADGVGGSVR